MFGARIREAGWGYAFAVLPMPDVDASLAEIKRALGINAHAGEFFDTLAHFAINNRRYADAVDFGSRAIALR